MKILNWGLPSTAVLIVRLALIFGGRTSSNTTTQSVKPASDSAATDRDDTDGITDLRDPNPYDAHNGEPAPAPSLDSRPSPRPKYNPDKPTRTLTLTACDANIRIKPAETTCGFAQNVFYGYWMNEREHGTFAGNPGIPAYSTAAGKIFYVDCSGATEVVCRADDGGYVAFRRPQSPPTPWRTPRGTPPPRPRSSAASGQTYGSDRPSAERSRPERPRRQVGLRPRLRGRVSRSQRLRL